MTNKRNSCIFFIALCSFHGINGLSSFAIDFETLKYEFNSEIVKLMTLKLVEYNNHNAVNGSFVFLEDLHQFEIKHCLTVPKPSGKLRTILNFTVNGCEFLGNSFEIPNPLTGAIFEAFRRHMPEFPSKCPLRKNKEYSVKNFHFDEEMFPIYLPETNFNAYVGLIRDNISVFKIYATGYLEAKNGQRYRNRTLQRT